MCRNPGAFWSPDSGHGIPPMGSVSVCFINGARNLGLISCPESGLQNAPGFRPRNSNNSDHVVWQLCCPCAPCLPPEKPIACPNPGGTSVCQLHGGCNLQPATQAVGAAGQLELSGLKCDKQLSTRQSMWPLLVTELYRQKLCPDSGHQIKTSFLKLCFEF